MAAVFRLPGVAAGQTKPGPVGAEAASAAAAGDSLPVRLSTVSELRATNVDVTLGGHLPPNLVFLLLQEFLGKLGARGDYDGWFIGKSGEALE